MFIKVCLPQNNLSEVMNCVELYWCVDMTEKQANEWKPHPEKITINTLGDSYFMIPILSLSFLDPQ